MPSAAPLPDNVRHRLEDLLNQNFSEWWEAFLIHALDTLKVFRAYGDDEGQLLAWSMAVESLEARSAPGTSDVPGGLTLSDISIMTGIPLETARRNLIRMVEAGRCTRIDGRYAMAVPEDLRQGFAARALAVCVGVATAAALPQPMTIPGDAIGGREIKAYLGAGLRYCSNLRRLVAKGAYLGCIVGGMLEVEHRIRLENLKRGPAILSRHGYNDIAEALHHARLPIAQIAELADEPVARVRAAVRHAAELGLVEVVSQDIFRYRAAAAKVPGDQQAYTRGVHEALADLVLGAARLTRNDLVPAGSG